MTGEEKLREFSEESFRKTITEVNERIYHFLGYGHSNCTAVRGSSSWILIDALDTDKRAERMYAELQKICDLPVSAIIFTHGHPDHRGGSGAFACMSPEVIAFAPVKKPLPYYDRLNDVLNARTVRQFGYDETDEEAITQGIGPREGHTQNDGVYSFLPPTTVYTEETVNRVIDGVPMELTRAPGETDDTVLVWLPEDKVICTGDNYYGTFPNLYAIRGTQYRDIAQWIASLRKILTYPAEALLPGHTAPLIGRELIQKQVGTFTDAIEALLEDTLACMNRGMTLSETAQTVTLRDEYRDLPYLGEFYGTAEWAVKSIYTGYLGWFDGSPAKLMPLPEGEFNRELHALIGEEKLQERIHAAIAQKKYQLALQLLEIADDKTCLKEALLGRASQMTSANGRHYLISSANEHK